MHRKGLHIILSLILLVSTTGITFSMHYCGGKYVSTSLYVEMDTCCDDGCGCCENKNIHYEVEEDFTSPAITDVAPAIELDLFIALIYYEADVDFTCTLPVKKSFQDTLSPPVTVSERLSLLQSFLC
ncbi:HYC_CC_PP family protein [Carboxylicivirga taeanensis]|uniref:HYC_CC_PP family protein n=1 Tax=Carboxylicivirga taeanensis TaxID=1416875 RepID=UPI003F6DF4FA